MHSRLKDIVARKQHEVALARVAVPVEQLKEQISELGRPRNFFRACVDRRHADASHVIAEIMRPSPAAGAVRAEFDPVALARAFAASGASALACATDAHDFGGRLEHIHQIRDAVKLPVLRKDLLVDLYQVWESRAAGADAILLVAEALPGINNRDLRTMRTSIEHCMRLAEMLENTTVLVAEGGIETADDLRRLRAHGIHIAMVGEQLLRQDDPGAALRALLGG
jgi:indole-3-glycerol phosphate synthase